MIISNFMKVKCLRCRHEWIPRKADVRVCPKCHSALWDKEE